MSVRPVFAIVLSSLLAACVGTGSVPAPGGGHAPTPVTSSLHGDGARPAHAGGWARSELFFGVGRANVDPEVPGIGEAQWREFLDAEVTTRFPDGLTVADAYGQWLFRGNAEPNRLRSKVLIILHEDTPERNADIEAIRLAWKQAHGHQSVLWAKTAAQVSF